MSSLMEQDPEIGRAIQNEIERQRSNINLIASENYASAAVLEAQGSVFTNKYAEGYPGRRYYGGCEFVDVAERLAISRAKKLFGAEHANVQPHSGAQANMAAYFATVQPGDTIMGMSLDQGGHLTHGASVNFSAKIYDVVQYGVDRELETIDYNAVEQLAKEHRPKVIVTGASAYTRIIDFPRFRSIADEVGAKLMVDMAHIAGLVAADEHPSPIPHAEIVTTTTHKTLRGPRGGMILCDEEHRRAINSAVFPNMQGGPLEHIITAKAVAFGEAMQPEVCGIPEEHPRQRSRARGRIAGGWSASSIRRHGQPHRSGGSDAGGHHRAAGRRGAGRGEHRGKPQRHPVRPEAAAHGKRLAARHAFHHQPRHGRPRSASSRPPNPARARQPI